MVLLDLRRAPTGIMWGSLLLLIPTLRLRLRLLSILPILLLTILQLRLILLNNLLLLLLGIGWGRMHTPPGRTLDNR